MDKSYVARRFRTFRRPIRRKFATGGVYPSTLTYNITVGQQNPAKLAAHVIEILKAYKGREAA